MTPRILCALLALAVSGPLTAAATKDHAPLLQPGRADMPLAHPLATRDLPPPPFSLLSERPVKPAYVPTLPGLRAGAPATDDFGRKAPEHDAVFIRRSRVESGVVVIPPGGLAYLEDTWGGEVALRGEQLPVLGKTSTYVDYDMAIVVKENVTIPAGQSVVVGGQVYHYYASVGHEQTANHTLHVRTIAGTDWEWAFGAPVLSQTQTQWWSGTRFAQLYNQGQASEVTREKMVFDWLSGVRMDRLVLADEKLFAGAAGVGDSWKSGARSVRVAAIDAQAGTVTVEVLEGGQPVFSKTLGPLKKELLIEDTASRKALVFEHGDIIGFLSPWPEPFKDGKANLKVYGQAYSLRYGTDFAADPRFAVYPVGCPTGHNFGFMLVNKAEIRLAPGQAYAGPQGYFKVAVDKLQGDQVLAWHMEDSQGHKSNNLGGVGIANVDLVLGQGRVAGQAILKDVGRELLARTYAAAAPAVVSESPVNPALAGGLGVAGLALAGLAFELGRRRPKAGLSMDASAHHTLAPDVAFDGGDLDCGNGLLLLIRKHIDPLPRGGLLEIRSTETSVEEDLPAWCRMTKNELVSWTKAGRQRSFLVCKGTLAERGAALPATPRQAAAPVAGPAAVAAGTPLARRAPVAPPPVPALAVTGMGSWPRPRWLVDAMHASVEGRLDDGRFQEAADDAVRLIVAAQQRAGATLYTDGEQRRDSYASFVGSRLDNCQLVPLSDLLPLMEDPAAFEAELRALDVPAGEVRHPGVFGRIRRSRPIAVHELDFLRTQTPAPVKVALPGPYLLTRTMWMDCIAENVYGSREEIAADIVRVLREEIAELLDAGAALVQLDEPVLSDVVFTGAKSQRSFMCGALSESAGPAHELGFAQELVNAVVAGFPRERLALHVCRGNWTPDESVALSGSYAPLIDTLAGMRVGAYLLEACTPRAGDMALLQQLPADARIGVGVVNQKTPAVEPVDEVAARIERAIGLFGAERLLLHPDCGFATFADNPICSATIAEAKLASIAQAAARFAR